MMRTLRRRGVLAGVILATLAAGAAVAAEAPPQRTLITNARIFDGKSDTLTSQERSPTAL